MKKTTRLSIRVGDRIYTEADVLQMIKKAKAA